MYTLHLLRSHSPMTHGGYCQGRTAPPICLPKPETEMYDVKTVCVHTADSGLQPRHVEGHASI